MCHENNQNELIQTYKNRQYFFFKAMFVRSGPSVFCSCDVPADLLKDVCWSCVTPLGDSLSQLYTLIKIHLNMFNWIVSCHPSHRPPLFTPFMFSLFFYVLVSPMSFCFFIYILPSAPLFPLIISPFPSEIIFLPLYPLRSCIHSSSLHFRVFPTIHPPSAFSN